MSMHSLFSLHRLVWTALMAASIAVGAFLIVPMVPVPVSLQPLFVMLAGFILGPERGAAAVTLYVLAGVLGLPVFAGGKSGLPHLLGPTGGYLIGFIGCAAICGFATRRGTRPAPPLGWNRGLLHGLLGLVPAYGLGLLQLMVVLKLDFLKAVAVGFLPFFPTDLVKLALAVQVYRHLHKHSLLPR